MKLIKCPVCQNEKISEVPDYVLNIMRINYSFLHRSKYFHCDNFSCSTIWKLTETDKSILLVRINQKGHQFGKVKTFRKKGSGNIGRKYFN